MCSLAYLAVGVALLVTMALVGANKGHGLDEGHIDPAYKQELRAMIDEHFVKATGRAAGNHVNRAVAEKLLRVMRGRPLHMIETGTSAWGIDSTRLFDNYIRKYGGYLHSVDIRDKAGKKLIDKGGPLGNRTRLHLGDSVEWLKKGMPAAIGSSFPESERAKLSLKEIYESVDIFFLDSHDVDWEAPDMCAFHGFSEVMALLNPNFTMDQVIPLEDAFREGVGNISVADIMLRPGALIWIDDTPKTESIWEPLHGGRWHAFHMGPKGEKLSYMEQKNTLKHLEVSDGIFPGKGSFSVAKIFNKFPEKFRQVFHEYSIIYKVL